MTNKSYEEILEEYEKFFNLDEEHLNSTTSGSKKKGHFTGSTRGANIIK